jgi:two-component system OmpR family response regulator
MDRQIAYVEDDDIIRENYTEILRDEGFRVHAYGSKADAMAAFGAALPDLALLDVSLHGERDAGYQICMELRRLAPELPIIFLTSHDGEVDRISGLRVGADDYLTKDASVDLIVVRIEALFRRLDAIRAAASRAGANDAAETEPSPLRLDDVSSRATWQGQRIDLPLTLYWILKDLVSHPGTVRSHRELMRAASIVVEPNTITAHVKAIRDAFREVDGSFDSIRTERGRGYRWVN